MPFDGLWLTSLLPVLLAARAAGKPAGLQAARKLVKHRKIERWASKRFQKSHSISHLKANPLMGACMAKGIVLEKVGVEAKQPNSAIRKCVRVQLIKNGKKARSFVSQRGVVVLESR